MNSLEILSRLAVSLFGIAVLAGASSIRGSSMLVWLFVFSFVFLLAFSGVLTMNRDLVFRALVGVLPAGVVIAAMRSLTGYYVAGGASARPFSLQILPNFAWGLSLSIGLLAIQLINDDGSFRRAVGMGGLPGTMIYVNRSRALSSLPSEIQAGMIAAIFLSPILASLIIRSGLTVGKKKSRETQDMRPT